ncbi:MAG TPA: hypothetical protein VF311_13945 [Terriglobales bacterium]
MMKTFLFVVALLSLALAGGCAKGGNGLGSGINVTVSDNNISVIYATQSVTFKATVTGTTNTAVTWSLSGTACTGTPNPCGAINPTSGVYVAPATAPSPSTVTITATSQADSTAKGELGVHVVQVTVFVTPTPVTVGQTLVQQFTAVAVPDDAPQTFTWTCTPNPACGSVAYDPSTSYLAVYTAPSANGPVVVAATSTVPQSPAGVGQAKVQVATSRLPSGAYAFRFSGYDNSGNPVAAAGSFILAANGTITAGVEDVLTAGTPQQFTIASVKYLPHNNTDNNLGTLTLALNGGPTNTYTAVLTSSFPTPPGTMRMIESDSTGTGSGVMQKSAANTIFNNGAQTFVFGFTGVDAPVNGNRVGYVGMLPMDGSGNIGNLTPALLDPNDNGTNVCGAQPCSVKGTYSQPDVNLPTWWHMTLKTTTTQNFDFFVSGGQTNNAPNPLTLYAISTDLIDGAHPALSGSMVYQFPMTYNNAAFAGTSVSNLTGASANVSLTLGTTDGTSGGSGGTGGFTGNFDQNSNNGTILSVSSFSYQYGATGSTNGRYTFQMLGNPGATPPVAPLPFVLYASGANRGFLLDQSSLAVMTGTMDPQPAKASGSYAPSEMPGTYAAATISNSDPTVVPVVQNLLLTSPGGTPPAYNVTGTQNPGSQTLTGTYLVTLSGTGMIALTAPAAATSAIYAIDVDVTTFTVTDFMMIGTCAPQPCSGVSSSVIFAQQ